MTVINCSQKITWEKLVDLAKASAKSGKESTDFSHEGFSFGATDKLIVDDNLIDAAAFQTAINGLDSAAEGRLNDLITLRELRDEKLTETDWVVTKYTELGQAIPNDWKTYRQSLRDLPASTSDPANPTWPTEPK